MNGIFAYLGKTSAAREQKHALQQLKRYGTEQCDISAKKGNAFVTIGAEECDNGIYIMQCSRAKRTMENSVAFGEHLCCAVSEEIENFESIKAQFVSPQMINTDNDLIHAIICALGDSDLTRAAQRTNEIIVNKPSFILAPCNEDALYCSAGAGEMIIGISRSGFFVSNDFNSIIGISQKHIFISSGELAKITVDKVTVYDSRLRKIKKSLNQTPVCHNDRIPLSQEDLINCPVAIKNVFSAMTDNGAFSLEHLRLSKKRLEAIDKIIIFGDGDAFFSARAGESALKMLCDVSSYSYPAAELLTSHEIVTKNTLLIAIDNGADSGKTIKCIDRFKGFGAKAIGIAHNEHCPLSRHCDCVISTDSPFADGTLSGFLSSAYAVLLLALYIGEKSAIVSQLYSGVTLKMAEMLPAKIASSVKNSTMLERFSSILMSYGRVYFAGQNLDYAVALRGAQVMRSIAGINASAHYTDQLLTNEDMLSGALVIVPITTKESLPSKLLSLQRAKLCGATVMIVASESIADDIEDFDCIACFGDSVPLFNSLVVSSLLHKIALLSAQNEGRAEIA